ncbi:MAG: Small-conductance mechanosensitive channel MscMJ [Candidatus Woesearchaeota archaeon]|nr:Small-conductance mechanosensitive channel MscMJ [Candidatus Woesearchaeota archaeon]
MDISYILELSYMKNTIQEYLIFLGIFLSCLAVLYIFKIIILNRLRKYAKKTKTYADDLLVDIIHSTQWPLYVIISLYISVQFLTVTDIFSTVLKYLVITTVIYYSVKAIQEFINYAAHRLIVKNRKIKSEDAAAVNLIKKLSIFVVWVVAFILLLSNLGVNVTGLVTGLGIGGIAVAFALQNILADLFASISINLDKPFTIGDFIVIGDDSGTVKKIGIKSTRIKTLRGEELVVSNKELTETRIHNYKKMDKRRVSFEFAVASETSDAKLKKIPKIVEKIISGIDKTEHTRTHLSEIGDFSINYKVVYHIQDKDFGLYRRVHEKINLGILREFNKQKIEMPYPTQTILVEK